MGKSAIRRAIVEIYGKSYLATPVVDFDNVAFKALYENLLHFANTTKLSKTTTLSNFWQCSILIELVKSCASECPNEYDEIQNILDISDSEITLSERLLQFMEKMWNKIDDYTRYPGPGLKKSNYDKANLVASNGLTSKFISELRCYPLDNRFNEVIRRFFNKLSRNNHRVILILDGFDKLRNDGAPSDAINLLFESLVDAILSIRSYRDLPEGFEIKAFIPHDRYLEISLRDSDKVDTMHSAIRWYRDDLQGFLKKRLELTPKIQFGSFYFLWRQVMPEYVYNAVYKIEEDSFDYLVRHSMMRPRQLQVHLEHLSNSYRDQIIDPKVVSKSISESCKQITQYYINEFSIDHPNLGRFIGSLHGKDNIFEYKTLVKITRDALRLYGNDYSLEEVWKKVDVLYAMGLFGVVHYVESGQVTGDIYCPPSKESRRHYVDFFYKNPHPNISTMLVDDSLIAIHPIFYDYVSLRPHSTMIVG